MDVPAVVTQEEGHTGFFIHLTVLLIHRTITKLFIILVALAQQTGHVRFFFRNYTPSITVAVDR